MALFQNELVADVDSHRPDGPPQPDLGRALANGDEHDGQDADAPDHQRDARDTADQ